MSDGSNLVPDHYARCLRRALDQKVRKLRSMLIADEDITTELDLVVSRLMKLALQTSRGRNAPPLTIWMQCKLLDLLTLTEKTIERRKKRFIENYPLKAINCDEKSEEMTALDRIKEDNTASKIVDKYEHLVKQQNGMEEIRGNYRYVDLDVDDLSVSSGDFGNNYDYVYKPWTDLIGLEPALADADLFDPLKDTPQGESKLKRTQAWVHEDIEEVPYPSHGANFDNISIETDVNNASVTKYYKKRYKGKKCVELNCLICKKSHSKVYKRNRAEEGIKENAGNTKHLKKVSRKKSINNSLGLHTNNKFVSVDYKTYKVKSRRKQHKPLYPTASKPIPESLVDICQIENVMESCNNSVTNIKDGENMMLKQLSPKVAETKRSLLKDIITEDTQETIALRRTIGTDVVVDPMSLQEETLIRSYSDTFINEVDSFEKHTVATGDVNSDTIFLYDIDEPTTSKGIRHTGMDVQCGPDAIAPTNSLLSATTSLTRMSKKFSAGIKIDDTTTDTNIKRSIDCCTCTYDGVDTDNYKTILPRDRSIGIEIKDSYSNIKQTEFSRILEAGFKIEDSNTDTEMKSTECSTGTNDAHDSCKHILPTAGSVGFTIKGSTKNTAKQLEFPTVPTNSILSVTTSLTRMPQMCTVGIKVTDSTPEVRIKRTDCGTCTYYACDSYNVFPREQCVRIKTENMIKKIKISSVTTCPMLTAIASLTRMSTMVTEGVQSGESTTNTIIKSGEPVLPIEKGENIKFKTIETESTAVPGCLVLSVTTPLTSIPQQMECSTNTQESIHELKQISPQSLTNKITLLNPKPKQRSTGFKVNVSGGNIPNQRHSRSTQGHFEKSNVSSLRSVSKDATLLKSVPNPKSIDIKIKEFGPKMERSTNTSKYDKRSNDSVPLFIETGSNLPTDVKTEDPTSDLFVSVDSRATLPMHSKKTLQNSDLQIISAVHKEVVTTGQPSNNYVKTKLCNGGLQVHSYRDKSMSEDIMYQGEWQKNRPKVLTKKKLFNTVVSKIGFDSNLKRKVKSKEKFQIKNSAELNNKSKVKDTNKNEIKFKKIPVTVTVDKARKPFRNILKVPSNIIMSSVSPKKLRSDGIVKKPSINPNLTDTKDDLTLQKINNKNYIPLYLRKRALKRASDIHPNDLNLSLDSAKCINQIYQSDKTSKQKAPKTLIRSKTEEIRRDLFKFHTSAPIPQYVVLRNEIEQNNRDADRRQIQPASDSAKKRNNPSRQRSVSPGTSPNSSSCSSPCSVATVKAVSNRSKNVSDQRRSTSYKNSIVTSGSESTTPTPERTRRFTKRSKSAKATADKVSDNKENLPQSSKQNNIVKKESLKLAKRSFMGQNKDVYIAHLKESPPLQLTVNTLSKKKSQKSNVPRADSIRQKRSLHIRSPSLSGRPSLKYDIPLPTNDKEKVTETSQTSNMVLVIEAQVRGLQSSESPKSGNVNFVNHHLVTNWIDHSDTEAIESHASNILSAMKELIDETLDFIDDPLDRCIIDSETVILSREDLHSHIESVSPISFKTTISNNENSNDILQEDIEFALNRSFDTTLGNESTLSLEDMRLTVTDFDVLSFQSVTSTSKISDYLSAENESASSPKLSISPRNQTSVRDIFERKDQPFQLAQMQNTPGALALQAFSGFSINGDPCPGDQPDYVNLVDSETRSLALDVARQATSEELLISGRSSESYQSCQLDEDGVVPNWLFQIISQQQSGIDQLEVPAELANVEPMYDPNGNLVETPVVGAGAGDGRGMHSDDSQDSSGRGTSISSSDTSSGQQSVAILIDPSSFVAQFDLLREAVETSVVLAINDTSENNAVGSRQAPIETEPRSFNRGESRRTPRARSAATASDVDADVSSLDTDADARDESDN